MKKLVKWLDRLFVVVLCFDIGVAYVAKNDLAIFGLWTALAMFLLLKWEEHKHRCLQAHYDAVVNALEEQTAILKENNDWWEANISNK